MDEITMDWLKPEFTPNEATIQIGDEQEFYRLAKLTGDWNEEKQEFDPVTDEQWEEARKTFEGKGRFMAQIDLNGERLRLQSGLYDLQCTKCRLDCLADFTQIVFKAIEVKGSGREIKIRMVE